MGIWNLPTAHKVILSTSKHTKSVDSTLEDVFFFLCVCICVNLYVHLCVSSGRNQEYHTRSPGTGIADICKFSDMGDGNELRCSL